MRIYQEELAKEFDIPIYAHEDEKETLEDSELNAFRAEIPEDADERDGIVKLPGVVSRKKQLVPGLMVSIEQ